MFLDTNVSNRAVEVALLLNPANNTPVSQGDWQVVNEVQLGLGGNPNVVFFQSTLNSHIGLTVYQNSLNPGEISIVFSPISFNEVLGVFPTFLPAPPQFNQDYSDDFASVYTAIVASFSPLNNLLVSGFSLGGVATNQLSENVQTHFPGITAEFVAFGSEFIASNNQVLNIGASNDWLFQSYNLYNDKYTTPDPELFVYPGFGNLFFMNDTNVQALSATSFLNDMFVTELREYGANSSTRWYFDFGVDDSLASFNRYTHGTAHSYSIQSEAVGRVLSSHFSGMITMDSVVIFDFNSSGSIQTETASNAFLSDLTSVPTIVFTLGSDADADTIYGRDGIDYVDSMGGNDSIFAGAGNDYVIAGDGMDSVNGGDGSDYLYGQGGDDIINAGAGAMDVSLGDDGNDTINGEEGMDYMYGYAGNDTLRGGDGDDVAYGGTGNDNLYGDDGADWLFGEAGNDKLFGGAGADLLMGGAGVDEISGGAGNDWMWGGDMAGAGDGVKDTFFFGATWGGDVIWDFENGTDALDVSGAGITSFADLTVGTFGDFATITSASGDIIYLRGAGNLAIAEASIDTSDFIFA